MRLIDADELTEYVWRCRLDSRERIADLAKSMPTMEPTEEMVREYCRKRCLIIVTAELFQDWRRAK